MRACRGRCAAGRLKKSTEVWYRSRGWASSRAGSAAGSAGLGLDLRIRSRYRCTCGSGFRGSFAYIFFSGASNYNYVLKINSKSSYPNWDTLADVPYSMCPTHAPLNARARYTLHGASSHALCVVDSTRRGAVLYLCGEY